MQQALRPSKTLGRDTPAERLRDLLLTNLPAVLRCPLEAADQIPIRRDNDQSRYSATLAAILLAIVFPWSVMSYPAALTSMTTLDTARIAR